MRHVSQHHFLAYTIEHILGAFFVIATAMFVGYAAYASDIAASGTDAVGTGVNVLTPPLLAVPTVGAGKVSLAWTGVSTSGSVAQGFAVFRNDAAIATLTVSSYSDSSGLTPGMTYVYYVKTIDTAGNSSLASNKVSVTIPLGGGGAAITTVVDAAAKNPQNSPVTFGVTIAPIVDCVTGKPMNEVFFVTSDDAGGAFTISSDGGIKNAPLEWGRYPLPNGTYTWNAVVKNGYVGEGVLSGNFTLEGSCPEKQTATPSTSPATISGGQSPSLGTFPLKYPENTSIIPTITAQDVRIKEGGTVTGVATFHVVAEGSTRTVFVLEGAAGVKQYIDKQLGVIHKEGTDEWSTLWNTANIENGTYTLAALMDTTSGTIISKKISFVVKNTGAANGQNGIKPVLKVFMNNNAVASGATLSGKDLVEFRVSVPAAKKVSFYAMLPAGASPLSLAVGVVDDLLSNKEQDVWTASWDGGNANPGSYKIFARVLSLDGTVSESALFPLVVLGKEGGNVATSVTVSGISSATPPTADKEEILARITSPLQCSTEDECKIFCSAHASSTISCVRYARTVIERGDDHASLASGIHSESIMRVLADPRKRSDIPLLVNNADDFVQFCANPLHADSCAKTLAKNDLASSSVVEEKKKALFAARASEEALLTERTPLRAFFDSDKDAVSDYDEMNIYHTDPSQSDTDGDGTPDNVEITEHTNPHDSPKKATGSTTDDNSTYGERVSFEDPLIAGVANSKLLAVSNVQVAEVGIGEEGTTTVKKLFLSGKALPNSYVTLYIFSTPILITIKTDYSGSWSYTLDKELENGTHQAVVALADEQGHILAKSETLPFVKSAGMVSIGADATLPTHQPLGTGVSSSVYIAIIIGVVGLIVSMLGFLMHKKEEKDGPLFPVSKGK